jgi:hypothetical protein
MLKYNSSTTPKIELYSEDGSKTEITPRVEDAFVEQLRTAVNGVATGVLPAAISGRSARASLATVLAEAESVRSGAPVSLK